MCKGEPGLARLGRRLLGRRGARRTVGMGRTGVTAWGQSRGPAAVRPRLSAIGARTSRESGRLPGRGGDGARQPARGGSGAASEPPRAAGG